MTASRPHDIPSSRRAARALREEALLRASEERADTQPTPVIFRVSPLAPADAHHPSTRREVLLPGRPARARHARRHRIGPLGRAGTIVAVGIVGTLLLGSTAAVTAAMSEPAVPQAVGTTSPEPPVADVTGAEAFARMAEPLPAEALAAPEPAALDVCSQPAVTDALAAGDASGVIAAAGGADTFRTEIAEGRASCIPLDNPNLAWVVVNKARPYAPIDFRPASLVAPQGVRNIDGGWLRADAAAALTALVQGAAAAGAGEVALGSAFRSYATQQRTYSSQVVARGVEGADLVSARPGYSEHQSGLTCDVLPCNAGCGTIDDLDASPQGAWVKAHASEYGFIVRYTEGKTEVTGYIAEPWHLRYVGPELAAEYTAGGWQSLEEFFGLPAAPQYLG
ncbi:M15 family metallopeptidase [Microbacterium lacus]|uniref:M15 family metallopeptidase n=1 Tax=Microbacterium lacus TaxID=415217 RepID=UPI00384FE81D